MQTVTTSKSQKSGKSGKPTGLHINIRDCTELCMQAHRVCTQTISHCLAQGGGYSDVKLIRLLMECAEACALNASFLMRGSDLHYASCLFCTEVTEQCAIACGKFDTDVFMQKCTEICLQCAIACKQMQHK